MSLRVAIVDDEPLVRQGIQSLLSTQPSVDVVALCGDGLAAIAAIEKERPDLVFLDIRMPAMNGFEVLEALDLDRLPGVVFVTAHDEYALRAFGVHAVDYVLKPFDDDRLLTALGRARERLRDSDRMEHALRTLLAERDGSAGHLHRFVVRRTGSLRFVRSRDVDLIRACDNYVVLHDQQRQTHMVRSTIKGLVERLDPAEFCRIHRSAIVRLEAIRAVRPRPSGDADIELVGGQSAPLSRLHKHELMKKLSARDRRPDRFPSTAVSAPRPTIERKQEMGSTAPTPGSDGASRQSPSTDRQGR